MQTKLSRRKIFAAAAAGDGLRVVHKLCPTVRVVCPLRAVPGPPRGALPIVRRGSECSSGVFRRSPSSGSPWPLATTPPQPRTIRRRFGCRQIWRRREPCRRAHTIFGRHACRATAHRALRHPSRAYPRRRRTCLPSIDATNRQMFSAAGKPDPGLRCRHFAVNSPMRASGRLPCIPSPLPRYHSG